MDLGLSGRVALIAPGSDALGAACRVALEAEGARVFTDPEDAVDVVDIVVAHRRSGGAAPTPDLGSLDELHEAWGHLVDAVAAYRRYLPGMGAQGWGRLVWVGSAGAKSVDADDDELGAIVSLGMMGAHKVAASESGPANVTANTVLRGGAATDEDVAAAVTFLCSEGAGYMTGVTIAVDGGAGSAVF